MAGAALLVVLVLFALVAPFVLYYLVRAEHEDSERMDREAAEQTARRDTADRRDAPDRYED